MAVTLPKLAWRESPNQSARVLPAGVAPHLLVAHRPVGAYGPSIEWLCNPVSQASCHAITEGRGTGVDVATQLVPWHRKAWTEAAFNSLSYGIEVDDDAWADYGADRKVRDQGAFLTAARIFAFLCERTGIDAVWSRRPLAQSGIVRHYDLGASGGGHTDPTTNLELWRDFIREVQRQQDLGGFRKVWGRGSLAHI